jgi:tRNA(fMet)-specific endonuclease VapC
LIIIDTDVLIEISNRKSEKGEIIHQKIISNRDNVAITSMTFYETLYGFVKFKKPFDYLSVSCL